MLFRPLLSVWGDVTPQVAPLLQRCIPAALFLGNRSRRALALTFDDGPHPGDTPALLAVLARHNAPATFFPIGERVARWPALVCAATEAGHQIGLHSMRHRPFVWMTETAIVAELMAEQALLARVCGRPTSAFGWVRPPYAVAWPRTLRRLRRHGYRVVLGSSLPVHWAQPAERTIGQVLRAASNGAIIILHEAQTGPPIANLVDDLVPQLRAAGYTLVTIEQLWQGSDMR